MEKNVENHIQEILNRIVGAEVLEAWKKVGNVYVVGGCLRDAVLGQPVQDVDVVRIGGNVEEIIYPLEPRLRKRFLVNDRFRTIRCVLDTSEVVDFSQAEDLHADLGRRDFAFNAMAYDVARNVLLDPFYGMKDIIDRRIRAIKQGNIIDDPVRILRGFRFISELNFSLDSETIFWFGKHRPGLRLVAPERLSEEIRKIFSGPHYIESVRIMQDHSILSVIFPTTDAFDEMEASSFSPLTLWDHTCYAMRKLEEILRKPDAHFERFAPKIREYLAQVCPLWVIRLSVFLHDIGKPKTRRKEQEGYTYYGHDTVGAEMVEQMMTRYRFSNEEIDWVKTLVAGHLRVGFLADHYPLSPRAIYRFFKDFGDKAIALLLIARADILGYLVDLEQQKWGRNQKATIMELLSAYYERSAILLKPPRLLTGEDLKQMGIPAGPIYSLVLDRIAEAQIEGLISSPQEARQFVLQFLGRQ